MTTLFIICATLGGTLLICQTVLTVMGLGGDHDLFGDMEAEDIGHDTIGGDAVEDTQGADHSASSGHHSSTWFFGIVTFRTVVAALTFFGLSGMASHTSGITPVPSLTIAIASGFSAMMAVHWLMKQIARMRADGSVHIDRAVGMSGTVYLKIPGHLGGPGKIHLNLQNRTVELSAWTDRSEIATGSTVTVSRVIGPDSVEVRLASVAESTVSAAS